MWPNNFYNLVVILNECSVWRCSFQSMRTYFINTIAVNIYMNIYMFYSFIRWHSFMKKLQNHNTLHFIHTVVYSLSLSIRLYHLLHHFFMIIPHNKIKTTVADQRFLIGDASPGGRKPIIQPHFPKTAWKWRKLGREWECTSV